MASAEKKPEEKQPEGNRPELRAVPPTEHKPNDEENIGRTEVRPQISWIALGGLALDFIALFTPALFAIILSITGVILGYFGLAEIRSGVRSGLFLAWAAIVAGILITFLGVVVLTMAGR